MAGAILLCCTILSSPKVIGCASAALSEAAWRNTLMRNIQVLRGAIAAGMVIATVTAADQWPSRPIRTISPFPAGSASDTTGRVVLEQISQLLGQPFVIENRAGAGGILGFAEVAKANPDGYTLVTSSSSMANGVVLHKRVPYDPVRDFAPVVMF